MKGKLPFISFLLLVIWIIMSFSVKYIEIWNYSVGVDPVTSNFSFLFILVAIFIQVFLLNNKFDKNFKVEKNAENK